MQGVQRLLGGSVIFQCVRRVQLLRYSRFLGCVAKTQGRRWAFGSPEDRPLFQAAIPNRLPMNRAWPGSVANTKRRVEGRYCPAVVLRSDAEDLMNETNLASDIALGQPSHLPFFDHVHGFISGYRIYRSLHRAEPEAGRDPLFDEPVVLLNDVVQKRSSRPFRLPAQSCAKYEASAGSRSAR